MMISKTPFADVFIIEPKVIKDERGYFFESFNQKEFDKTGLNINFYQDNQALSNKGVLRGLHYQLNPFAQAKLVRVITGSVLDVIVDLRKHSTTYGKWFSIELSSTNFKQLFVPRGFAHGYLVLEDNTIFSYKCDGYYNKEYERGILFNDKTIGIEWPNLEVDFKLSEKDLQHPLFINADKNF